MRRFFLIVSHAACVGTGFALGIYLLPILTAPASPDAAELQQMARDATYTASSTRDRRGSDFLHWGEGIVSLSATMIVHEGKLAPGPDYRMYLVPAYVEHEDEFLPLKASSVQVGEVRSFGGAVVRIPEGVNIEDYTTVLIWCEAFGEFITSAQYR
ncbi:DM13 domain-containing protein [Maliponia aquimaris]|uniref:Electron transfer DM13 n=1 Tax=Maliponia aquimaris TaxID=1673631 RepID=A0A238JRM2_9RHOB|nr:DM13 domain-containing protein [Maliponia aquimaris]SMX33205.1 Electron transfer DM13 [Maliponia aquimaris]